MRHKCNYPDNPCYEHEIAFEQGLRVQRRLNQECLVCGQKAEAPCTIVNNDWYCTEHSEFKK